MKPIVPSFGLFVFFNFNHVQNKSIVVYIGEKAKENVWVWSIKHNDWASNKKVCRAVAHLNIQVSSFVSSFDVFRVS